MREVKYEGVKWGKWWRLVVGETEQTLTSTPRSRSKTNCRQGTVPYVMWTSLWQNALLNMHPGHWNGMASEFYQSPNLHWCVLPEAFLSGPLGWGLKFLPESPCPLSCHNTGSSKTSWISPLPSFIQQKSWVPPLFPQHIPWPQGTYTGSRWIFSMLSYQLELFRHSIVLRRRLLSWEFSLFIDFLGSRARFSVRRPKIHMMYDMFKP